MIALRLKYGHDKPKSHPSAVKTSTVQQIQLKFGNQCNLVKEQCPDVRQNMCPICLFLLIKMITFLGANNQVMSKYLCLF